jgi:hypothetical protein
MNTLRTYPVENPEITLTDVRVAPCTAVVGRGGELAYCGHTVAMRREFRGVVTVKCHGVGCKAVRS